MYRLLVPNKFNRFLEQRNLIFKKIIEYQSNKKIAQSILYLIIR